MTPRRHKGGVWPGARGLVAGLIGGWLAFAPVVSAAQSAPTPAVTLVEQAATAYRAGRYAAAAELFVSAFELSKAPIQLRNAAKAYERAEQFDRAQQTWRRYLEQPGLSDAERAEATAETRALEQRLAAQRATADAEAARRTAAEAEARAAEAEAAEARALEAQATATAPAPRPPSNVPVYLLFGAGAAAAVTSAVLFFHANARLSDLDRALETTDGQGRITGISVTDAESERSGVEAERTASAVLLGAGLAAAAGGTLWLLLADDPDPAVQAAGWADDGGAYATVRLRF